MIHRIINQLFNYHIGRYQSKDTLLSLETKFVSVNNTAVFKSYF